MDAIGEFDRRAGRRGFPLIGGKESPRLQAQDQRPDIELMTYEAVFSAARTQLDRLIKQLNSAG